MGGEQIEKKYSLERAATADDTLDRAWEGRYNNRIYLLGTCMCTYRLPERSGAEKMKND